MSTAGTAVKCHYTLNGTTVEAQVNTVNPCKRGRQTEAYLYSDTYMEVKTLTKTGAEDSRGVHKDEQQSDKDKET